MRSVRAGRSAGRGSHRRLLSALLALLLGGVALLTFEGPVATAEEPRAYVRITFERIEPALPTRAGTITLTGRVTNVSKIELSNLQAIFWRSRDPIRDPEGMEQALNSAANQPLGERKREIYQNIPNDEDRTLDPGESTRFTLRASVADLELPRDDGVFLIGVHVRGYDESRGPDLTLGRGRIFLPLVGEQPDNRMQMTSVVVLSSRPSLVEDRVFADDHLAAELAAGGRLAALTRAADRPGMSFAVDPALVEEVAAMAEGYRVLGADGGEPRPGTGQTVAARWLDSYRRLARDRDGFRLLYGTPDVAALVHAGQERVLARTEALSGTLSLTASLPLLAVPTNGAADAATVAALERLRPAAVVLSDSSVRGPGPLLRGPAGVPIVSYSGAAFGGGPGPGPRNTPSQLQQRLLADTWIEVSTAPPQATLGRVRLITGADQARGDEGDLRAPWTRRTTLGDLLRSAPSSRAPTFHYPARAAQAELSQGQLAAVQRLTTTFGTVADLLVNQREADRAGWAAVARASCGCWRGQENRSRTFVGRAQHELDTVLAEKITLSAPARVVTSGRTGQFGITVRNRLEPVPDGTASGNAVKVWVRFESTNSQRLTIDPLRFAEVQPGSGAAANVRVNAQTNGTVRVRAQLSTDAGAPIGRPVTIDVTVTQAGTTGWIIAIAAGIVLVGTTALRIRQVAKERAHPADQGLAVSRPAEEAGGAPPARETLDV